MLSPPPAECGGGHQRYERRRSEIAAEAETRIGQLSREDAVVRDQIVAAGRSDITVVSKTACEPINAQTRRVLDLDDRTDTVSVSEFLASHGLTNKQSRAG